MRITNTLFQTESGTSRTESHVPTFSLPAPDLEGMDDSQRVTVKAMIPILPLLVDQVFQMVNQSKSSPAEASSKKVTKGAQKEEDPEERKIFLVGPMLYKCQQSALTLKIQAHIKTYLHKKLHYTANSEIELHEPPTKDTVRLFLAGKHPGQRL